MKEILEENQLDDLINQSYQAPVFIFKHSTRCSISSHAFEEFQTFSRKHPEAVTAYISIIQQRDLSNRLAALAQTKHESPQVFLFKQGKPVWNASHWKIDQANLENALNKG